MLIFNVTRQTNVLEITAHQSELNSFSQSFTEWVESYLELQGCEINHLKQETEQKVIAYIKYGSIPDKSSMIDLLTNEKAIKNATFVC